MKITKQTIKTEIELALVKAQLKQAQKELAHWRQENEKLKKELCFDYAIEYDPTLAEDTFLNSLKR